MKLDGHGTATSRRSGGALLRMWPRPEGDESVGMADASDQSPVTAIGILTAMCAGVKSGRMPLPKYACSTLRRG